MTVQRAGRTTVVRWGVSGRLRRQLFGLFSVAVLSVVLGSVAAILLLVRQTEQADWRGRQLEATRRVAETVGDFLARQQNLLQVLDSFSREELAIRSGELETLLQRQPVLLEVAFIDADGRVAAHAPPGKEVLANLFTVKQSSWFLAASKGERYIGDVQLSFTDEPYLILAFPAAQGGVVAARLRMEVLNDAIAGLHFGRTGIAYLLNQQGCPRDHASRRVAGSSCRGSSGPSGCDADRAFPSGNAGRTCRRSHRHNPDRRRYRRPLVRLHFCRAEN
jgi:hypothetical protein